MVDPDTGGEERHYGLSEGKWNNFRKMTFAQPAPPQAPSPDETELPTLSELPQAEEWARDHEVTGKEALAWTTNRTPPTVDLRLAQPSLPVISQLLVSEDMAIARTL